MSIRNISRSKYCRELIRGGFKIRTSDARSIHRNNIKSHSSDSNIKPKGRGVENVWANFKNLSEIGLSEERASGMLEACPRLGTISEGELSKRVAAWRRLKFGEEACARLFAKNPQLLAAAGVEQRFPKLRKHFAGARLYTLISTSPNVVTEDWCLVEERLGHLLDTVKVPAVEIAKSGALRHPFHRIRDRYAFLVRSGRYTIPDGKETDSQSKNPTVAEVLNTSDRQFSTVVAGLSLFEYEVFRQLQNVEEDSDKD